jgi:hypothetical protein
VQNLLIALLTSAYEAAANASGDELARRQVGHRSAHGVVTLVFSCQFEKLEDEGYAKLKRARPSDEVTTGKRKKMEQFDLWAIKVMAYMEVRVRWSVRPIRHASADD